MVRQGKHVEARVPQRDISMCSIMRHGNVEVGQVTRRNRQRDADCVDPLLSVLRWIVQPPAVSGWLCIDDTATCTIARRVSVSPASPATYSQPNDSSVSEVRGWLSSSIQRS